MAHPKINTPEPGVKSTSVSDLESLKEIQEMFKTSQNKKLADLLLAGQVSKRPDSWSNRTVASYYKERFALELKAVVDDMMKSYAAGELIDVEWSFKDFPEMAVSTMYNKLNQSKRYLLDKMDVQGIYSAFFQLVNFSRERTGVRLSYARDIRNPIENSFRPKKVEPLCEGPTWKIKIDKFIQTAVPKQKEHIRRLSLTAKDIEYVNELLSNIEDILFEVNEDEIKLVKLSQDDVERLK